MTNKALRRRILTIASAAVGVPLTAVIVGLVWEAATTVSVSVLNDRQGVTRLSGCVDDSLDLNNGQTGEVDIPGGGRVGCMVYAVGVYKGCLILRSGEAAGRPIPIFASLNKAMGESSCQAVI